MHGIIIMGHLDGPSVHYEDRIYDMSSDGTTWTITVREAGQPDETFTTPCDSTCCGTTQAQALGFVAFRFGPDAVLRFDLEPRRATLSLDGATRVWEGRSE